MMECFLKRSKTISSCQNDQSLCRASTSDSSSKRSEKVAETVTVSMDYAVSSNAAINVDDLCKSHLSCWRQFGHSICSNQNQHWGVRRKPKTALFKELKLTNNRGLGRDDDLCMEKPVDRWGEQTIEDRSFINTADSSPDAKKCNKRKQLLQFDKSQTCILWYLAQEKPCCGTVPPFKEGPGFGL
ncbi:hypothetical protein Pint_19667 [Pistacia integerrima]|uniref:Uncharacterized protein n=1 Tax=Pistacia integerrima TaxID=434235 RepID=A0ACC0XGE4_9ROSI|nr:hypothetical protein Pint_19667 [Pistacia integerrima]